jgi:2-C-methyl-D-erythritol 4-phosphate cytidylyltransferase
MALSYSAIVYAVEEGSAAWGGMLEEKLGGKAVLNHSLDAFEDDPACAEIIVLAGAQTKEWITGNPLAFAGGKLRVLPAATTRAASMLAGAREAGQPLLVLHDALRPNAGPELLARVVATAKPGQGAAPVWPVGRTLAQVELLAGKAARPGEESVLGPKADHRIAVLAEHRDPALAYTTQTPQAFSREDYLRAAQAAASAQARFNDDSALCRAAGLAVALVRGRLENLRLDSQDELRVLQKLMGTGPKKKEKYTGLGW